MDEQVTESGQTDGQDRMPLLDAIGRAFESHCKWVESFIVPGFVTLMISDDVRLRQWGKVLHSGMYFLQDGEHISSAKLYMLTFDEDSVEAMEAEVQAAIDDGCAKRVKIDGGEALQGDAELSLHMRIQPVAFDGHKEAFTLTEALAWLAIGDAETAGDEATARAYFKELYSVGGSIRPKPEEVEELELFQIKPERQLIIHALMTHTLDGMLNIARGESEFIIEPRKGSKSIEQYVMTASQKSCSNFFYLAGGNQEEAKLVYDTVCAICTGEVAKKFIQHGRIWITVNTIVEEMRRTTGGTVRARNSERDRSMVEAALNAFSGMQISGVDPSGKTLNKDYIMNAVRRDWVNHCGTVYADVWGFDPNSMAMWEYASRLGHTYSYPLLESETPLKGDAAWINRYLRNILNEARGRLYTYNETTKKARRKRTPEVKIKRSWDTIFSMAYPMETEIDSRKKRRLVETFNDVLGKQAEMEVHGEVKPGMPMSIEAHSERDAKRGRGKGAWSTMVITCRSDTRAPNVDLM